MGSDRNDPRRSILFVCMGNICRSPLAEGVFIHQARGRGVLDAFEIDSCGTGGWHVGERPDARARAVARGRGVDLPSRARQLDPSHDFDHFDLLVVMDDDNRQDVLDAGAPKGKVVLLRSFDRSLASDSVHEVPDPYYGGADGFDVVFEMVDRACSGLLDHLIGADRSPQR